MNIKMNGTAIVQEIERVICKCEVKAFDKRTARSLKLLMYVELTDEEQEPKPIVEKILNKLGFSYYGFESTPITTSVNNDAEELFKIGKAQEEKDLHRQ